MKLLICQVYRGDYTIPGILKLLIALRFFAVGAFYQVIADIFGVGKSTVEKTVCEVAFLISTILRDRFVVMPETQRDLLNAKIGFMRLSGFPICIAAVDGTHILIQSFGGPQAEVYRNRKMVFSLNCQFAVSADVICLQNRMKFIENIYFSNFFFKKNVTISGPHR